MTGTSLGRRISWWVPVAFAITGFLIGFTTGLSSSPVVKALLPLMFGLLAGGGGFFAKLHVEHSKIIGVSLSVLALMAVVGIIQGIVVRDDSSWHSFWKHRANEPIPLGPVNASNLKRYLALLILRSELQKTALSGDEQAGLLRIAAQTDDESLDTMEKAVTAISDNDAKSTPLVLPGSVPSLANQSPSWMTNPMEDPILRTLPERVGHGTGE